MPCQRLDTILGLFSHLNDPGILGSVERFHLHESSPKAGISLVPQLEHRDFSCLCSWKSVASGGDSVNKRYLSFLGIV